MIELKEDQRWKHKSSGYLLRKILKQKVNYEKY